MPKTKMKDIVVLLPGIMGSVLEKDGKPVWDIHSQALLAFVKSWRDGSPLAHLKLVGDDLKGGDIGDGIRATRLMPKVIISKFKSGGYSVILDKIAEEFDNVLPASKHETANLFEFPYDWRRDNRASAHLLEKFIGERLKRWRESSNGAVDAKVILIAHSMGGLVARYYLEVLGGWQDCKALITFGTPHRGAPSALQWLVNSKIQKFGVTFDLSEVISSCPSIYQLLPIYEMVHVNGDWKRVAEIDIPGIDRKRAEDALAFHRKIEEEQKSNSKETPYQENYQTMPFFGIQQNTVQSADLSNGTLTLSSNLPPAMEKRVVKNYGDGTVPHFSAVPIEFKPPTQNRLSQTHGFLQSSPKSLDDLCEFIANLEGENWSAIRDPETNDEEEPLAISLSNIDDFYTADEPVELMARLTDANIDHKGFKAIITPLKKDGSVAESMNYKFQQQNGNWTIIVPKLEPGLYQVEVRTGKAIRQLNPVYDLFPVIG